MTSKGAVLKPRASRVLVHFGSPQGAKYEDKGGFVNGR